MKSLDIRGAIKTLFGGNKHVTPTSRWQEVGSYQSIFTPYSGSVYANDICRASIHTLAEQTSKANPKVKDQRLEKLLQYRPNMYMNGKDFLYKVRTLLEVNNTAFIYIDRDDRGKAISFYPMPACNAEALEAAGGLYIKFWLPTQSMVVSWADLAVLRKHYNTSDIFGDSNTAIATSLELLDTTNQGMANAIKSTANLRGILKSTKAMLSDDDVKKQRDRFVSDYLAMSNTSGIAMTDATLTFTPIQLQPAIANYKSVEELRNNIYRYFGVSEEAILGKLHSDAWEAFYDSSIEPFLIALGQELTYKVFSERERGFANEIIFESNRLQYMSMAQKLELVQLVDRGAMTPNQWAEVFNLPPQPGGDIPRRWQDPQDLGGKDEKEKPDDNEG